MEVSPFRFRDLTTTFKLTARVGTREALLARVLVARSAVPAARWVLSPHHRCNSTISLILPDRKFNFDYWSGRSRRITIEDIMARVGVQKRNNRVVPHAAVVGMCVLHQQSENSGGRYWNSTRADPCAAGHRRDLTYTDFR